MKKNNFLNKASIKETIQLSLRGYKIWWIENPKLLISTALYGIINSLLPYVNIWLLAKLIDEIAGPRSAYRLRSLVLALLCTTAVLTIISAALERWKNVQWASIWHMQNKIIMSKLFSMNFATVNDSHTQNLRFQIWQNNNSGAWGLYKLLFCFNDMVHSIMSISIAVGLTLPLFMLPVPTSCESLTFLNDPFFIVLFVAVMLFTSFVAPFYSTKAGYYWIKFSDEHKMGNRLFDFWLGVLGSEKSRALDVRIYRQDILSKYNLENINPFNAKSKLSKAARGPMGGFNALSGAISQIFVGIAYIFVCLKALGGAFGAGSVTQYISSIIALSGGVSLFISTVGNLRNNTLFLQKTFEFLDMDNNMIQGNLHINISDEQKYEIEFRNVSFKYPGQEQYALRDVSLTFRVGQKLAVVGMNGSGKTTFIKLLCRLYDPTEGEILLNGVDIRSYDYHEYMSIFSVVFQDFKLLSFELGQNIAGKMNYDNDVAESCLKHSGFSDWLDKLPERLATILYKDFDEKGISISGGEAQKIALARALYKNAAFIILDEPTAALDPVAEFDVYNRMNDIIGDKTAIFISHRLSSCRFWQDIVVFHKGQLIQRGSHDELVADKKGKYFELWNAQAQYYTKADLEGKRDLRTFQRR